ncbi:MAG: DUF296 domain-containing protein [Clostridia bacterium]|nr:DUF296 domain-containing protein [Clostridia bacterium]
MRYEKFGDTWLVRLDLGEEISESLKIFCGREGIRLAQVNGLGAANRAAIGVFVPEKRVYSREELDEFMEIISLTGNVTWVDDQPFVHLHAALADQRHGIHCGHVLEMYVGATCELFVSAMPGQVTRVRDESLGINLMHF